MTMTQVTIGVTKVTTMSGTTNVTFNELVEMQIGYQENIMRQNEMDCALPTDSKEWFMYHVCAMVEEMGEVMKSDKRWKSHRNKAYNRDEKLEELADVFITAMNMCIFSGFSGDTVANAIKRKIENNTNILKPTRTNV